MVTVHVERDIKSFFNFVSQPPIMVRIRDVTDDLKWDLIKLVGKNFPGQVQYMNNPRLAAITISEEMKDLRGTFSGILLRDIHNQLSKAIDENRSEHNHEGRISTYW